MNTRAGWLDEPKNIKVLWRGFIVVLALTVGAEIFIHPHPQFEIESWFGLNAVYGFIACALMIVGAKALGLLLKRPDTYYTKEDDDQ